MSQLVFDDKLSRQLEANYSRRDFQRRRRLVNETLNARPGERILDVGCGPGFYVAELVERVGRAGAVVGLDVSADMLSLASRRCKAYPNVSLHKAPATSLPFEDSSFDAVLSVQVLEFVENVDGALTEMHRVLRPGGRLVLWDVDWATVSWHSADADRMARVLHVWDGHLGHPSLPRTLGARLRSAGFDGTAAQGHAFATIEFTPDSYGVSMLPVIERYVASRSEIGEAEAHAWAAEQHELGESGRFFFACVQFCFDATRG